ncbi:hypothetical protein [Streptomyces sp. SM12]|uniref:hypothetical protein n=1 Tax=Streptomyces sp. SM12 TaxID=1071602 RepID=UPI000CD4E958|nr:hypothetical protein [Streptomyces sp. SM12]
MPTVADLRTHLVDVPDWALAQMALPVCGAKKPVPLDAHIEYVPDGHLMSVDPIYDVPRPLPCTCCKDVHLTGYQRRHQSLTTNTIPQPTSRIRQLTVDCLQSLLADVPGDTEVSSWELHGEPLGVTYHAGVITFEPISDDLCACIDHNT